MSDPAEDRGDGPCRPTGAAADRSSTSAAATPVCGGRSPVVVVGLGPVGATAALLLAGAGVPVVAIDRDHEVYPHPRAVALDDDALRVLQAAGVRDGDGLDLLPGGTVRIRGRRGRTLVELGPPPTSTGHPGLAFFRQPQLERTLRARLEAEPLIDLRLGTTVLGLASPGGHGHGAELQVAEPDGTRTTIAAPWVLACDGARSTIRTALGIRLRGTSSPSRWLVVDTDAPVDVGSNGPFRPTDFEFGADPHGPWVHGPLPGGAHRWEFLLPPTVGRGEPDDQRAVRQLLARRSPGAVPAVRRAAVYAFHARVAVRWRVGRVVLLGDAAHLSPPFAGQGLCAGLRDAGNVAWKVAAAWHGTAEHALLDTYARERLPHVLKTTALAVALGTIVELRRTRPARVRDAALRRVAATGPVRRWIAGGGWRPPSTLGRGLVAREPAHRWRAGEALPQPAVALRPPSSILPPVPSPADLPTSPAVPRVEASGPAVPRVEASGPPVPRVEATGPAVPRGHRKGPAIAALLDDVLPVGWVVLGTDDAGPLPVRGATAVPWSALPDLPDLRRWLHPADVALVRPDRVVFGTTRADGREALLAEAAGTVAFGGSPRAPT